MYSGLAISSYSGRIMGAHQQIDRIARRRLSELMGENDRSFPSFKEIVTFEGRNGPDGIKVKSPAYNEPWHFLDPLSNETHDFMDAVNSHYRLLVKALKASDRERAAFEAAWLAHAVVDGMTPAHHYPYEATIQELRGGKGRHTRTSKKEKVIFKGDTKTQTIANMYRVYGPRGLFTAHHLFEFGVMLLLRPLKLADARPSQREIESVLSKGPRQYFMNSAREVAALDMYDLYLQRGWTPRLSNKVRNQLAPAVVKTVTLLWYSATVEAGL